MRCGQLAPRDVAAESSGSGSGAPTSDDTSDVTQPIQTHNIFEHHLSHHENTFLVLKLCALNFAMVGWRRVVGWCVCQLPLVRTVRSCVAVALCSKPKLVVEVCVVRVDSHSTQFPNFRTFSSQQRLESALKPFDHQRVSKYAFRAVVPASGVSVEFAVRSLEFYFVAFVCHFVCWLLIAICFVVVSTDAHAESRWHCRYHIFPFCAIRTQHNRNRF
jgi:hypothetical protein